jgi:GH24 family phage-related lysozyme (muramidase)
MGLLEQLKKLMAAPEPDAEAQLAFDEENNFVNWSDQRTAVDEKKRPLVFDINETPEVVQYPDHIIQALNFIKKPHVEGFVSKPKPDPASGNLNQMAFGYGLTVDPRTGKPVGPKTPPISREDAEVGVVKHLQALDAQLNTRLTADLSPFQRAALLSKLYNRGPAFLKSDAIQHINLGNIEEAAQVVESYKFGRDKSGRLIELPGLAKRAKEEAELIRKPWVPLDEPQIGSPGLRNTIQQGLDKLMYIPPNTNSDMKPGGRRG